MSKIEEALKKAKEARRESGLELSSRGANSKSSGNGLSRSVSATGENTVKHLTSTKEIALIDDGDILEAKQLAEFKIIHSSMKDRKIANTYRDLRTKLIQKSKGKNFIAMVTSCTTSDDCSSTTLNLSTAFALDESKTSLLIDCNLSQPRLDALLNIEAEIGLTDFLENDDVAVESILHKTGIKRLKMIPVGSVREAATEYFTSLKIRKLMKDLTNRYSDRYIFLDTAPISSSADTRILVELCDFVLLVVPYGRVTKSRIKEAAEAIGEEKLLGVVFSDIPKVPSMIIPGFSSR